VDDGEQIEDGGAAGERDVELSAGQVGAAADPRASSPA
jgi:hypothetical protein